MLDVKEFGLIFEKRKGLTTDLATRPFWEFVGSGLDGKGKFGESKFIKENIDETIFMFALFKCRKSDKGRN